MPKLAFILVSALLMGTLATAQTPLPNLTPTERATLKSRYFRKLDSLNQLYRYVPGARNNKFVQSDALDTAVKQVFATVILTSDEVIQNGTAGSISQDKDKATLSFNYSKMLSPLKWIGNLGLYGTSTGGVLQFYSGTSWQKGAGLTFGFTRLWQSNFGRYDASKFDEVSAKRNRFIRPKAGEYLAILDMHISDSLELADRLERSLNFSGISGSTDLAAISRATDTAALAAASAAYARVTANIARYKRLVTSNDINSIATATAPLSDLTAFDTENYKSNGYLVQWWSFNADLGIRTNKLYNDTLYTNDSALHFYTKDYGRISATLAWNISSMNDHNLWYLSFSVNAFNTNFLENRKIADMPLLRYDSALKKIAVRDNEGTSLGTLDEYKSNVLAVKPAVYYALFWGKLKVVGIELAGSYQLNSNTPKSVTMPNTFSTTAGILLRVNPKDGVSKGTVGLVAGLFDAAENTQVWHRSFGLQLKVGVPFNALFAK